MIEEQGMNKQEKSWWDQFYKSRMLGNLNVNFRRARENSR